MNCTSLLRLNVAVLGACGGVGQALSLLLAQNRRLTELRLYDTINARGEAIDLSHIPRRVKVTGYTTGAIARALDGADLVMMPAGTRRRPGMFREDLFNANKYVVQELSTAVAQHAPHALLGIICDPLNSMVGVAAETLRQKGAYDPRKLFGINALDSVRARTLLGDVTNNDPEQLYVPVIGGHSGQTIVPLFSRSGVELSPEEAAYLTHKLRMSGDVVVKAKEDRGGSSLAPAFAFAEWVEGVLRALDGESGVVTTAIVESPLFPERCRFFASEVELDKEGVARVLPLPKMSAYEEEQLDRCLPDLEKNIRKGQQFAASRPVQAAAP